MSVLNINIEELLKDLDTATLQALDQSLAVDAPTGRKIIQNILDEPLLPKPFQPTAPPRKRRGRKTQEILRKFDPISRENIRNVTNYLNEILDLYDNTEHEGEEVRGRCFIRWRFIRDLERDLTPNFMAQIREKVHTSFYVRHVFSYQLRNIEDDSLMVMYTNIGSPWFERFSEAEKWLSEREKVRLDPDNINRADTTWVFENHFNVDIKVVFDRQPLLGTDPLPDWLRNLAHSRSMLGLDTYKDNLCLWRCIGVHRGSRPDRSTTAARELAKSFFNFIATPQDCRNTSLYELDEVERHINQKLNFSDWLGIRVYEPERVEGEAVWHLRRNPPTKLRNILTIGIYEGHAFIIKDISKLAKTYACVHCRARFTQACSLQRHTPTCAQGKTMIDCPAERVEAPQTAFEKAFYPKHSASPESLRWLEQEAARWKIHIHHAACGHGGERWVEHAPVDRYNHEMRTVFQYHGCHWHRCRKCYPNDRNKIIARDNQTREERFKATVERTEALRAAGYQVIEAWSCEVGKKNIELPRAQMRSYPHAILHDFEAYGDKNQRKEPTGMLTIENTHVPISVSIGDTLEREPTHICERDPAELVHKFMEELDRRGKNIRAQVKATFMPDDVKMLTKTQRLKIEEWCNQVPVLGFNSGRYDLNLIREHFAERLSDTTGKVRVSKNGNKIMFILTNNFRFLDIINYLGPSTSYEKWVKAYECETVKSWFPYDWFDTPEKPDFRGLRKYEDRYSKLKGGYVLTREEWEGCQRLFKKRVCVPSQTGCVITIISMWLLASRLWKRCVLSTLIRESIF